MQAKMAGHLGYEKTLHRTIKPAISSIDRELGVRVYAR